MTSGQILTALAALFLLSALPAAAQTRCAQPSWGAEAVTRIIGMTNAYRRENGLANYRIDANLTAAALAHACDMGARNYYSHAGADGSQPMDRVRRTGFSPCQVAENLAFAQGGRPTARQVFDGWRGSSGHNANLLHRVSTHVGLGIAEQGGRIYWTMVFAKPC